MNLRSQTKVSITYVFLLTIVQIGSLCAIYWLMTESKHPISIFSFSLIALFATLLLIIGSLAIFNQMLKTLQTNEQSLIFQSKHDPITNLPNRIYFFEYLTKRLSSVHKNPKPMALMTIGIDRFPQINQALGYQIGDRLLNHVAERLKTSISQAEFIGRLASNVFIILLPDITPDNYRKEAEAIFDIFSTPFSVYTVQIDLDILIGLSFFPQDGIEATQLIQRADLALYAARYSTERCEVYKKSKDPHHQNKLSLMSELREGLTQNEFYVFYQPKVHLIKGQVEQVEALIRWEHPIKGFLSPDQFIPLAEETGHIKKLTLWLLEQSIMQCSQWHKENIPLGISINLSVKDLLNKKLPSFVASLIKEHAVTPSWITLEITESAFMREPDLAIAATLKLKQLGVNLSIDDFGTGYSSLSYLKKLPVNELKIDKSFTQDIILSERVAQIVKSTIRLGQGIDMTIVAEGLQDENTLKMLKHFGCDLGQGYLFSQPLPLKEFTEWLKTSMWGIPHR